MDIYITSSSVLPPDTNIKRGLTASAAITAGDLVNEPDDDDQVEPCGVTDTVYGLALNDAAVDQPVLLARGLGETVILGDYTVQDGQTYVRSPNAAGGIAPIEDVVDGQDYQVVGTGSGTDSLVFEIQDEQTMPSRASSYR